MKNTLDGLYQKLYDLRDVDTAAAPQDDNFLSALYDDLNTPLALSVLGTLAKNAVKSRAPEDKAKLISAGKTLGILQEDPAIWLGYNTNNNDDFDTAKLEALLQERQQARAAKDFARADVIREQLGAKGVQADDGPEGTTWRMKA
jgi:cysteinyl-tRNA synthetase